MTDEEIISGLVRFSEHVSKSKIEKEIGMPKNSLATILKGNKPVPPKHRQKMIDLLKKGFPPPKIDPEEIQRKIAEAKANILEHMKGLKLTGGDRIEAEKGQDAEYMTSPLEPIVQAVNLLGGPEVFHKKWALREDLEAMDDKYVKLQGEFKALKEENEKVKADNNRMSVMINALERERGAKRGQSFEIKPEDRKILNPNADKTKQVVEPEPGTSAYFMRNGKWGDDRDKIQ